MTRFIDEERQNIGVLRALGYSKFDTSLKFIVYSLTAALTGVLIGAIGGYWLLPQIIFNSYTANLTLTNFQTLFSWKYLFLTILIAVLCTTGAAFNSTILGFKSNNKRIIVTQTAEEWFANFLRKNQTTLATFRL